MREQMAYVHIVCVQWSMGKVEYVYMTRVLHRTHTYINTHPHCTRTLIAHNIHTYAYCTHILHAPTHDTFSPPTPLQVAESRSHSTTDFFDKLDKDGLLDSWVSRNTPHWKIEEKQGAKLHEV